MSYIPASVARDGDKTTFMYENVSLEEMPKRLHRFFLSEGYKLESGNMESGVYGTGSHTMRILFGAFVKRYTFRFKFSGTGNTCRLELGTNMTGVSGGVIGYNKLRNENLRLVEKIRKTEL